MLRKFWIVAASVCAASLLGASLASAGNVTSEAHAKNVAAKQCAAEKKADRAAFRSTYGDHAMRNCIRGTTDEAQADLQNAAQQCRSERSADADAFRDTYGDNQNGRNAFGKCVSSKVRADRKEDVSEFKNAAQECRDERSADVDAFRATYGDNHNGRNAMGKCVSQKVKQSGDEETTSD